MSSPFRSGPSRDWIKVKNPDSPAMIRARSRVVTDGAPTVQVRWPNPEATLLDHGVIIQATKNGAS
jgi:hypothetical protein